MKKQAMKQQAMKQQDAVKKTQNLQTRDNAKLDPNNQQRPQLCAWNQNKQELKNRQNKQKQTKPYLQNKQLISACGSRAGQRMQEEGKYML